MAVYPDHRYSNESEKDNYDDFKLKKIVWSPMFLEKKIQRSNG